MLHYKPKAWRGGGARSCCVRYLECGEVMTIPRSFGIDRLPRMLLFQYIRKECLNRFFVSFCTRSENRKYPQDPVWMVKPYTT